MKKTILSILVYATLICSINQSFAQCLDIQGETVLCLEDEPTSYFVTINNPAVVDIVWSLNPGSGQIVQDNNNEIQVIWAIGGDHQVSASGYDIDGNLIDDCIDNLPVSIIASPSTTNNITSEDNLSIERCGIPFNSSKDLFCTFSTVTLCLEFINANAMYTWSIDGNLVGEGACISTEFTEVGFVDVCIVETIDDICFAEYCETIQILAQPTVTIEEVSFGIADSYNICNGQDLTFFSGYTDDNNFPINNLFWSLYNEMGLVIASSNNEPFNYTFNTPGIYTLETYANSCTTCESNIASVTIHVEEAPVQDIECASILCEGNTDQYCTEEGCAPYEWMVIGGQIISGQGTNCIEVTWDMPTNGFGSVQLLSNACSGTCEQVSAIDIPIIQTSGTELELLLIPTCQSIAAGGINNYTLALPYYSSAEYFWTYEILNTISDGTIEEDDNLNTYTLGISGFIGDILITGSIDHQIAGCNVMASTIISPRNYQLDGNQTLCAEDEFVNLTVSPPPPSGSIIEWNLIQGITSTLGTSSSTNFNVPIGSPGSYTILFTVTEPSGLLTDCGFGLNVTKAFPVSPIESIEGFTEVCLNDAYLYTAVPDQPGIIHWEAQSGEVLGSSTGASTWVNWNGNTPPYIISAVREVDGCFSDPFSLEVVSTETPTCLISTQEDDFTHCMDATITYFAPANQDADNYIWSIGNTFSGSVIAGQGTNEVTIQWHQTFGSNTNPTLSLNIYSCGTSISCSQEITLIPGPDISINAPEYACISTDEISNTVIFEAIPNDPNLYTYQWSIDGETPVGGDPIFETVFEEPGTHTVNVILMGQEDCPGPFTASHIINIIEPPNPIITTPDLAACWEEGPFTMTFFVEEYDIPGVDVTYSWLSDGQIIPGATSSTLTQTFDLDSDIGPVLVAMVSFEYPELDEPCIALDTYNVMSSCPREPLCFDPHSVNFTTWAFDESAQPDCGAVIVNGTITPGDEFAAGNWSVENNPGGVNPNPIPIPNVNEIEQSISQFNSAGFFPTFLNVLFTDGDRCTFREVIEIPMQPDFEWEFSCPEDGNEGYTLLLRDRSELLDEAVISNRVWSVNGLELDQAESEISFSCPANITPTEITVCLQPTTSTTRPPFDGQEYSCQICKTIICPAKSELDFETSYDPVCAGVPVEFQLSPAVNQDEIISYSWNFFPGLPFIVTGSNLPNPVKVFYASQEVELITTNIYGCTDTVHNVVEVVNNIPNGEIVVDINACESAAVLSFSSNEPQNIETYNWAPGNINVPELQVSSDGIFNVTVTNEYGCTAIAGPETINLEEPFLSGISGENLLCEGEFTTLSFTPGDFGYEYHWILNGTIVETGTSSFTTENLNSGEYLYTVEAIKEGVVCGTLETLVIVTPNPEPFDLNYKYDCSPFAVKFETSSGQVVIWELNGLEIGFGPSIVINSSGSVTAILENDFGCQTESETIFIPAPIDLSPVISGCYNLCDTALVNGQVCLDGIPGNFESWQWVLITEVNGTSVETPLLPEEAPGTGQIESLCLSPDLVGAIVLRVSKEYTNSDGSIVVCEEESEPFYLEIMECGEDCETPSPTVRTIICVDDESDHHRYYIHWDFGADGLVEPCDFDYGTIDIYHSVTQEIVGVFEWINLDNIPGYSHFEGLAVLEAGTNPFELCWQQSFCNINTGIVCGEEEICTDTGNIGFQECEPEPQCGIRATLRDVECLDDSAPFGTHNITMSLVIQIPPDFLIQECMPYQVWITSATGTINPFFTIIDVDPSQIQGEEIHIDEVTITWNDNQFSDFACFGVFLKPGPFCPIPTIQGNACHENICLDLTTFDPCPDDRPDRPKEDIRPIDIGCHDISFEINPDLQDLEFTQIQIWYTPEGAFEIGQHPETSQTNAQSIILDLNNFDINDWPNSNFQIENLEEATLYHFVYELSGASGLTSGYLYLDAPIYTIKCSEKPDDRDGYSSKPNPNALFHSRGIIQNNTVSLYPNPVNDLLHLKTGNGNFSKFHIVDIIGKIWIQKDLSLDTKETVINVAHYPSGVYLVHLSSEIGPSQTIRFVVSK